MTNELIAKTKQNIVFYEVNELAAKNLDLTTASDVIYDSVELKKTKQRNNGVLLHWFAWSLLSMLYVFKRLTLKTHKDFVILVSGLVFMWVFLGMDFFNNLGFWIGYK